MLVTQQYCLVVFLLGAATPNPSLLKQWGGQAMGLTLMQCHRDKALRIDLEKEYTVTHTLRSKFAWKMANIVGIICHRETS